MISSSERETVGPIRFLVDYLSCLISPVPVPCFRTATVLINPRRACARVTVVVLSVCVSVCLSVCLSVPALAASASVGTSKQRYLRVSLRLFLD